MPKTVFVSGNFNILHPGHLRLLRFARELGDRLVVGVQSDKVAGSGAHVPEDLRLEGVRCNSWVSEAFLLDEPPASAIARLRPDVVVKGREHEGRHNPEQQAVEVYGGRLVFSSGEAVFSSLDLIHKNLEDNGQAQVRFPTDYARRHGITPGDLAALIREFGRLRVCVVGDLILDEYVTCDALGMSQEDPTIVVTPVDRQTFVGGAGIVAGHAAGLGAQVHFFSVTGTDNARDVALEKLDHMGVESHLLADESRPTTLKQRFRASGKTLLRVSHLHQGAINAALQDSLLEQFESAATGCHLLVFSDFNYGCLPQPLVDKLVAKGKALGLVMAADSQCSSQVGDISRFQGMDLLTPTELEARISLRNQDDGLVVLAEKLRQRSRARNIILKLGAEGALLHFSHNSDIFHTDRIPALNPAPQDVAGAGDSMLSTSALALTAGATPWQAACLGSLAAAVQVGRMGNVPLRGGDLLAGVG